MPEGFYGAERQQFQDIAERCGASLRPFNQDEYLVQQMIGRLGSCTSFVLMWLKAQRHHGDFFADLATDAARTEFVELINQHIRGDSYHRDYLGQFGFMRPGGAKQLDRHLSLERWAAVMTPSSGYYVLCVSNTNRCGVSTDPESNAMAHAIGIETYGNKLFDPNCGELTFESMDQLHEGLASICRTFYGSLHASALLERFL